MDVGLGNCHKLLPLTRTPSATPLKETHMSQLRLSFGIGVFGIVWCGQLVSLIGSGLTSFVLGLWVYQLTGSVTQFALILFSGALPRILFSPLAGSLVDRWDRRRVMIVSDAGAGLSILA